MNVRDVRDADVRAHQMITHFFHVQEPVIRDGRAVYVDVTSNSLIAHALSHEYTEVAGSRPRCVSPL